LGLDAGRIDHARCRLKSTSRALIRTRSAADHLGTVGVQMKFAASAVLPLPVYFAMAGNAQSGLVFVAAGALPRATCAAEG